MENENPDLSILDELILNGGLEVAGLDDTGNFTYRFTPELSNVSPQLYEHVLTFFHTELMVLWEKGFLSMDVSQDNPMVAITAKAYDQEAKKELSEIQIRNLENIVRVLEEDEQK